MVVITSPCHSSGICSSLFAGHAFSHGDRLRQLKKKKSRNQYRIVYQRARQLSQVIYLRIVTIILVHDYPQNENENKSPQMTYCE